MLPQFSQKGSVEFIKFNDKIISQLQMRLFEFATSCVGDQKHYNTSTKTQLTDMIFTLTTKFPFHLGKTPLSHKTHQIIKCAMMHDIVYFGNQTANAKK